MEWRNWRLRSNESPSGAFKPQSGCVSKMERPRHDKLGDHLTQLRSSAMADPVFAEALAEASAFLVQRG